MKSWIFHFNKVFATGLQSGMSDTASCGINLFQIPARFLQREISFHSSKLQMMNLLQFKVNF